MSYRLFFNSYVNGNLKYGELKNLKYYFKSWLEIFIGRKFKCKGL